MEYWVMEVQHFSMIAERVMQGSLRTGCGYNSYSARVIEGLITYGSYLVLN